jgi:hypothetical protein
MLSDKWPNEADVSKIFILTRDQRGNVIDGLFVRFGFLVCEVVLSKQVSHAAEDLPKAFLACRPRSKQHHASQIPYWRMIFMKLSMLRKFQQQRQQPLFYASAQRWYDLLCDRNYAPRQRCRAGGNNELAQCGNIGFTYHEVGVMGVTLSVLVGISEMILQVPPARTPKASSGALWWFVCSSYITPTMKVPQLIFNNAARKHSVDGVGSVHHRHGTVRIG